ncbi:MAG TPA: cation:proton antiporter, partial [Thermodesulfobacteriota bacterium]|nr:cation:proton antiporter [Thermodesulfobacteriota bacterium]
VRRWPPVAGGLLLAGLAVAGFFLVRALGERLPAPAAGLPARAAAAGSGGVDTLLHVLLALAVVVLTARLLAALFRLVHQPPVMGEVVAGIVLGPSVLGRLAPDLSAFLWPPQVVPLLATIAQIGIIVYMFLVGLELNPALLRRHSRATVAIAQASVALPFLLGTALALWLYPSLSRPGVPFTLFALFMGVAMSVTAFPVLARILTDRELHKGPIGTMALACAAVNDVAAWCLLAVVVSVAEAQASGAVVTVALAAAYAALMLVAVQPAARWLVRRCEGERGLTRGRLALVFTALLLSALATEAIGIHALFGAFLLGAVIPHDSAVARELTARLEDVVVVLLLPAFFASIGLRTELGLLGEAGSWLVCGAIVLAASAGKVGGTLLAARLAGLGWPQAAALGALMNTRGLMELVVLSIGLELGIVSPTLFTMLVVMALVTTLAATPCLDLLARRYPEVAARDGAL